MLSPIGIEEIMDAKRDACSKELAHPWPKKLCILADALSSSASGKHARFLNALISMKISYHLTWDIQLAHVALAQIKC